MATPLVRWLAALAVVVAGSGSVRAQTIQSSSTNVVKKAPESSADTILRVLRENPATAPYTFRVTARDGRLVLAGRVGSKAIHDVAVNVVGTVSPRFDDRIVIDTTAMRGLPLDPLPRAIGPPLNVYPPPLFGRLDDPFYGFEPPLLSYPPWWGAVAARSGDPYAAPVLDPSSPIGPDPGRGQVGASPPPPPQPISRGDVGRSVEMTLDPRGVAILTGTVPTEAARLGIAQKAATLEGVKQVVNRLEVKPEVSEEGALIRPQDVPPPLPVPPGPASNAAGKVPPNRISIDSGDPSTPIERRLTQAIERRPGLGGPAVKVEVRDGVATLSGKVPTALEAMMAFRAAQQTVGVREIVDRLEFAVPDGQKPNPLISKARPEDAEPYLEAQIRRQMNDRVQIDRVRLTGDRLEVKGTVRREEDRAGAEAVLRSMPLLRGFAISATLVPE